MSKRGRRWLVLAVCLLAFALRVTGLARQSLWRDEVDAIRFALQPLADLLHMFVNPGQNGPLYYLALRPWLELLGQREFALRFPSAFLGVLAVPLVYRLARHLFPRQPAVALLSALFAATSPYLVWYGQEGKMYALLVVLVLVSVTAYLSALQHGGSQRWLGYVLATGLAFYVHLTAVLIVPVQAIAFGLCDRQTRGSALKPWLASLLVLVLPYLPLLAWQFPMLTKAGETGFAFVPLHAVYRSLFVNYSLGVALSPSFWTLAPFIVALLAVGVAWSWPKPGHRSLGLLLCWLLVPAVALFLVSLVRPLFTARYLIIVLPAYLILLAVGLTAVAQRSTWLGALLLGVVLTVSTLGLARQTAPIKADFRGATRFVAQQMEVEDLVLFQIPHGRYSFEYYLRQTSREGQAGGQQVMFQPSESRSAAGLSVKVGKHAIFLPCVAGARSSAYRWAEGPFTNHGMTQDQLDRRMRELVDGSRVVWLVATEVPLWDGRGLVQAWLEEHFILTGESAFVRVFVRRYRMP